MTITTNPTPTIRLSRPNFDADPWHDDVNGNFKKIDAWAASIGTLNIDGVWETVTVYAQGDRIFDDVDPVLYECIVAHTSGATTFDDDRVAHPTYWRAVSTGLCPRGVWITTSRYRVGDLVYQAGSQYLCKIDHTAGVFATDLAALKWEIFVQQGAAGAGSGNVTGPVSSVVNRLAIFSDLTGMTIADAGVLISAVALLASPAFSGVPTAPTAALGTNTLQIATTAFVKAAVDALLASAPGALDTLNELAAALGNDANFATTVTNALALKAPLLSPTLTGTPNAPTPAASDSSTLIATTAFVQGELTGVGQVLRMKRRLNYETEGVF